MKNPDFTHSYDAGETKPNLIIRNHYLNHLLKQLESV